MIIIQLRRNQWKRSLQCRWIEVVCLLLCLFQQWFRRIFLAWPKTLIMRRQLLEGEQLTLTQFLTVSSRSTKYNSCKASKSLGIKCIAEKTASSKKSAYRFHTFRYVFHFTKAENCITFVRQHADDFCFDGLQSNKVDSGLHHKLKTPILEG